MAYHKGILGNGNNVSNGLLGTNNQPLVQQLATDSGVMAASAGSGASTLPQDMPKAWKEFADQTLKTFKEFGLKVDRTKLFPTPVHLASPENKDFPSMHPNMHKQWDGTDYQEWQWLLKDSVINQPDHPKPISWKIVQQEDLLAMKNYDRPVTGKGSLGHLKQAGLARSSYDLANSPLGAYRNRGDPYYLGVSTEGAERSSIIPSTPDITTPDITTTETFGGGAPDFRETSQTTTTKGTTTKGTDRIPAKQNITGHEWAHYIDVWASNGQGSLSQIATTLLPYQDFTSSMSRPTAHDLYVAWMNDDRTKHLDVVDNINTVMQGSKVNNPREILGKFYVTAMLNPIPLPNGGGMNWNTKENIARAIGVFIMPDQSQDEGHIQGIKDMRGNVIGAIANLLNQE